MKDNKNKDKKKTPEKSLAETEFEQLSLFFDKYVSNGKLITKYASIYGIKRVAYIKGKDLKQFFTDNFAEIKSEILKITKIDIGKEPNKDSLQNFYELNNKRNIFHYLQRFPGDKVKYPKKLMPLKKGDDISLEFNFTENGFYSLNIKIEKSNKPIIYLLLLVLLILFVVLFPIWPLRVKLGVVYFLMGVIIFLISFLVLSIIICLIGVLIGYDILITPNIDDYKMSWKDRIFKDFIIIEKREDPCWFIAIRIFLIFSVISLCAIAYLYPYVPKECYLMVKNAITYVYNYGKKIIEDIHYQKKSVKVQGNQYLDDLNNL